MDTIATSSSYSPSVSPFPTPEKASTAAVRFSGEFGADRMVKIELEAAETLAALARSTENETSGCETRRNGGESASHRVDNESRTEGFVPMSSDLDQAQEAVIYQHSVTIRDFMSETVKIEQYVELKQNPNSITTNGSSGSCKSRQNLNEAEKESRKLRRVLANRESARQTIRRRQAFNEELTRKAADLALENENLKRERELAMKEYDSSKSRNKFLKARMTKLAKAKEIQEEETKNVEVPTCSASATCPIFFHSLPSYLPFHWPSIVQSSNSVHPQAPMGPTGNPDSYYVFPFPYVFPLRPNDSRSRPQSFNPNSKQQESPTIQRCSSSTNEDNRGSHLSVKVQTEVSNSTDPIDFPPDGGGPHVAQTFKPENTHRQDSDKAHLPLAGDSSGLPEKRPAVSRSQKVDAVAGAEARKRRKELKRLKNLHFRLST